MTDVFPPHLLNKQHIAALNGIRVHEGAFLEVLRVSRAAIYTKMEAATDTAELHCLRGQAGVMTQLIALIEDAGNSANRLG